MASYRVTFHFRNGSSAVLDAIDSDVVKGIGDAFTKRGPLLITVDDRIPKIGIDMSEVSHFFANKNI